MSEQTSPCYHCDKRYAGCHAECSNYKKSQAIKEEEKSKKRQWQLANSCISKGWSYNKRGK